jgi:hypothetical protein
MATLVAASYRNSLTLQPRSEQSPKPVTTGQVCRGLEELCAAGFLEAFRDEFNIVRYRPVNPLVSK